jgi:hypothetical protein
MSRSMIKRIQQLTCCLVVLFAVGAISFVSADPVLVFNAATGSSAINQNQSVGWQFNVTTAITVTGLSWYDEGANGLVVGHTVGIWNPAGTLLGSVCAGGHRGISRWSVSNNLNSTNCSTRRSRLHSGW